MDDNTRKIVLSEYQKRKTGGNYSPVFKGESSHWFIAPCAGHAPGTFLAGDLDGYPPFIFR
jgi:hypothetical protein